MNAEVSSSSGDGSSAGASTSAAPAPAPAAETKPARIVYHASRGRRTFFSFVFLILLPFFLCLPGMLYMRVMHGQLWSAIELGVFALAFAIVMFLLLVELLFSLRARVEIGEDKVLMTLPSGRGPTPMLRYKTSEVPYDQIQSVETRREVYGGAIVPVLLKGARLALKDGSFARLGYVSEACVDPAFPYPEIAKEIAERARLPVIDRGSVRRSFRGKYLGLRTALRVGPDTIDEKEIAALNRSHANVMLGLIGSIVALMLVGLVEDLSVEKPQSRLPAPAERSSVTPGSKTPAKPAVPPRT